MSSDSKLSAQAAAPSLGALRIAAACGVVLAVVLLVIGFSISLFWGVLALIASPVIPLVCVLVVDRLRQH